MLDLEGCCGLCLMTKWEDCRRLGRWLWVVVSLLGMGGGVIGYIGMDVGAGGYGLHRVCSDRIVWIDRDGFIRLPIILEV